MKYISENDGGDIIKFTRDFCSLCCDAEINEEIDEVKKYWKEAFSNDKSLQNEFANKMRNIKSIDELVKKFDEIISERNQIKNCSFIEVEEFPSTFFVPAVYSNNERCIHIKDSVNIKKLENMILNLICSDIKCVTCVKNSIESKKPSSSLQSQAIWLCLACCKPHCSRFDEGHGVEHYEENVNHNISIDLKKFNAWCYECEFYVVPSLDKNQGIAQAQAVIKKYLRDVKIERKVMEYNCEHVEESVNIKKLKKRWPNMIPSDINCITCVNANAKSLSEQTIWLCLACCKPHCSRFDERHGIQHYEEKVNHNISLDLKNFKAWCYECEHYVFPSIAQARAVIQNSSS